MNPLAQATYFSRQHVVSLAAGELEAQKLAGLSYWRIPVGSSDIAEAATGRS